MVTSLQSRRIWEKAHLLVGLLLVLFAFGQLEIPRVGAHATLLSASPEDGAQLDEAPSEIILEFSEQVGVVEGGTSLHQSGVEPRVLSPQSSGNRVIIPLDVLDNGSYVLQWRVISADSHPISGTVRFAVGDAEVTDVIASHELPGWIDWSRAIVVGFKYFGLLSSLGVLLVGWAIARSDAIYALRLSYSFAITGLVGVLAELPLASIEQRGMTPTSIVDLWTGIHDLQANILTSALVSLILGILTLVVVRIHGYDEWRLRASAGLMLGATLALTLSGHSQTREPAWLMMLSDAVHVTVAAIWIGGITILTIGLRNRWQGGAFGKSASSIATVAKFSSLAGYTAVTVALSGVVMAYLILDSFDALYRTGYGQTLLIKIGLVICVAALAAANRFAFLPKLNESMSELRSLVTAELVILVAVAGVTGLLVHQNPNIQASPVQESTPVTIFEGEEALDSDHTLRLTVKSRPGNEIQLVATIIDENRNIVLPDADLQVDWYLPEQNLGPISQSIPIDSSTGAYQGIFMLPAQGEWEIEVRVKIDRFTDSRTTIEIVIPD